MGTAVVSQCPKFRVVLAFPAGPLCRSTQRAQMGHLGRRAAQVLPDTQKQPTACPRVQLGEGMAQIRLRYPRDRQPGSDRPRHAAAEIRGGRRPERAGNANAHPQRRDLHSISQGSAGSLGNQKWVSFIGPAAPIMSARRPLAPFGAAEPKSA